MFNGIKFLSFHYYVFILKYRFADLTFLDQCKKITANVAADHLVDNLLPNSVCEDFKLFLEHVLESQTSLSTSTCVMHVSLICFKKSMVV